MFFGTSLPTFQFCKIKPSFAQKFPLRSASTATGRPLSAPKPNFQIPENRKLARPPRKRPQNARSHSKRLDALREGGLSGDGLNRKVVAYFQNREFFPAFPRRVHCIFENLLFFLNHDFLLILVLIITNINNNMSNNKKKINFLKIIYIIIK